MRQHSTEGEVVPVIARPDGADPVGDGVGAVGAEQDSPKPTPCNAVKSVDLLTTLSPPLSLLRHLFMERTHGMVLQQMTSGGNG